MLRVLCRLACKQRDYCLTKPTWFMRLMFDVDRLCPSEPMPLQKKTPFLQFGIKRQDTKSRCHVLCGAPHSASLQSKGQYSWAISFQVYGEGKRILYPTLTILLDASLQPSPPYVPYRNIIQSCELGSQGQVSPSVQILKERTWSWLCLQETECERPGVLFQACSPVSVVIQQVVCHRKSRKASGFSLTWNMFCTSWDN